MAFLAVIGLLLIGMPTVAIPAAETFGASEVAFSVVAGDATAQADGTVTIPLTFSHTAGYGLTAGSVYVTYDPDALTPLPPCDEQGLVDWELAAGEAMQNALCQVADEQVGLLKVSFVTAAYIPVTSGTLMELTFSVHTQQAGSYRVDVAVGDDVTAIRLADHAAVALSGTAVDGQVAVLGSTWLLGDVNASDQVNTTDARWVLQYAVDKIDVEQLDLLAADVDGNGRVNTTDARWILQYAAEKVDRFPAAGTTPSNGATAETTTTTGEATVTTTSGTAVTTTRETMITTTTTTTGTTGLTTGSTTRSTYPTFVDNSPDPAVGNYYVGHGFVDPDAVGDKENAEEQNVFKKFLLCKEDNETLPYSISLYISRSQKAVTALVPAGIDLTDLVPRFTYDGTVTLYGREIRSGVDALDFSKKFQLVLTAPDGRQNTLVVKVIPLSTGLPSFAMTTEDMSQVDSKQEYKNASFYLGGGDPETCFYANDETIFVTGQAKGRGNTSWGQEKKSYTIKFDTKQTLLDMDRSKDWVLVAGHEDFTLLRNVIGQHLGELAEVSFTLKARPVDLWYNGQYWGTYSLAQKIEIEGSRVDITEYAPGCGTGNTGFLLEFDGHVAEGDFERYRDEYRLSLGDGYEVYYNPNTDELFFPVPNIGKWLTIKKPSYTKYLLQDTDQIRYIYDYIKDTTVALKEGTYEDICRYIDVESFANWYIVEELMNNTDSSMHSSVYMTLDVGGKLKMGPVWDFDRSSGGNTWTEAQSVATAHLSINDLLCEHSEAWFGYCLYQHDEGRAVLKAQWAKFYQATAGLGATIDEWYALVEPSAALNFTKWHVLGARDDGTRNATIGNYTEEEETTVTYEGQVSNFKNFLLRRRAAMNAYINSL